MKRILWLSIISVIFIVSCQKDTPYKKAKKNNMGTVSAVINGKAWAANYCEMNLPENGRVDISASLFEDGYLRQVLGIANINTSITGVQKLHPTLDSNKIQIAGNLDSSYSAFNTLQDDIIEGSYDVIASQSNAVIVESFDISTNRITGSFLGVYYITSGTATQGFADTLRVTDGHFDITFKTKK